MTYWIFYLTMIIAQTTNPATDDTIEVSGEKRNFCKTLNTDCKQLIVIPNSEFDCIL